MTRHLLNSLTLISLLLCAVVAVAVVWAVRYSAKALIYVPYADGYFISSYHSQLCLVCRGSLVARDHWLSLPVVLVPAVLLSSLWLAQTRRDVSDRRAGRGLCRRCGYDLTGNVSEVCPECGEGSQ